MLLIQYERVKKRKKSGLEYFFEEFGVIDKQGVKEGKPFLEKGFSVFPSVYVNVFTLVDGLVDFFSGHVQDFFDFLNVLKLLGDT